MLTLRPRRTLTRSIGLPVLALLLPVLATLAWIMTPLGAPAVIATALITLLLAALGVAAWFGYQRTEVTVSRHGIVERGFLGRLQSTARRELAEIVRLETYRGDSLETVKQLFAVDAAGRCRFRMRGTFWDDASLDLVAEALDMTETVRTEPVTMSELRESDPDLLYWFEGRRIGG
ncbi:hypothetical protein GCM10009819_33510 [Agromyces tropicus]|uniref:DUF304 domain-containing protein n=1 Tax=Agromyces tropicus TaxID=555371 RepID=A0ABN2UWD3_9MICO